MSVGLAALPHARVVLPDLAPPAPLGLGAEVLRLQGLSMGTRWQVLVAGAGPQQAARLQAVLEAKLKRLVAQMSVYDPGSELSRFATLSAGEWLALPPDMHLVMQCALRVAELSGGAFDPTCAPVVQAWGFGPGQTWRQATPALPSEQALSSMTLGWSALVLDDQRGLCQPGGLKLDLGAVAKGHAVDVLSQGLSDAGWPHHLVEVGGELRGSGLKPDGQPWWVALEPPATDCDLPPVRVALCGEAVATSGNYRRHFKVHGVYHQHTMDPRTRRPVAHGLASVTVWHPCCMWADAWATALMVLGPEHGQALAEAQGLAALLCWREPDGHWAEGLSSALRARLS